MKSSQNGIGCANELSKQHREEVVEKAEKNGLKLVKTVEMPANNLSVIYKKQ